MLFPKRASASQRLVTPALKYTDYCIINELETQQTTGVLLRGEDGALHVENMKAALQKLHELGVAKWAVIHCPEIRLRHGRRRQLL